MKFHHHHFTTSQAVMNLYLLTIAAFLVVGAVFVVFLNTGSRIAHAQETPGPDETPLGPTTNLVVPVPVWAYRSLTNWQARTTATNMPAGEFVLRRMLLQDFVNLRQRLRGEDAAQLQQLYDQATDAKRRDALRALE